MCCASSVSGSPVATTPDAADEYWLTVNAASAPQARLAATKAISATRSLPGVLPRLSHDRSRATAEVRAAGSLAAVALTPVTPTLNFAAPTGGNGRSVPPL